MRPCFVGALQLSKVDILFPPSGLHIWNMISKLFVNNDLSFFLLKYQRHSNFMISYTPSLYSLVFQSTLYSLSLYSLWVLFSTTQCSKLKRNNGNRGRCTLVRSWLSSKFTCHVFFISRAWACALLTQNM